MGKKKIIKAEETEFEEMPEHLQSETEETELNHYIESKEVKKIKVYKTKNKKK